MKQKKFFLLALPAAIIVLLSASISFSDQDLWPNKEGELCWDVYSDPSMGAEPTGLLRLYIIKTGRNYYLVNGSNLEEDDEPLVIGNAKVYPDRIKIHASSSGFDGDEVRGLLGTIILDRETLNGSFQGVGIKWEKSAEIGDISYDGEQEIVFRPCP